MADYIGIDLGTTSVTVLLLDTESGEMKLRETVDNDTETTTLDDRQKGRSEWHADGMVDRVFQAIKNLAARFPEKQHIEGIGVTGQQHGMVLIDKTGRTTGPFIGWQDRRCHEELSPGVSYLDRMHSSGGDAFARSEYLPARGYMGSTLYWLSQTGSLPGKVTASFAPDYLVSRLCGSRPVTDPTNASGSGVFDVINRVWNESLINSLGLPKTIWPEVRPSCSWAGMLNAEGAKQTGLQAGIPVTVACGDNQASFAGSVSAYEESVLVNIGTGGQVSVYSQDPLRMDGLLVRPYLKYGYLLVGAGLTGGRAYGIWESFVRAIGKQIFDVDEDLDIYTMLNELAAKAPPGCDGLRCEPVFTGSLKEPGRRGLWIGIDDTNLTLGHMTRALLEGMADQFRIMYKAMITNGVVPRPQFIGAGNGVRKNLLLCNILSDAFDMPLSVVRHNEEAAVGAALCAAVASKEYSDIEEAGRSCNKYV